MGNNTPAEKETLRHVVKKTRGSLGPDWMRNMSEAIEATVIDLDVFHKARAVACYLSAPAEVQTGEILDVCWNRGKKVCVPVWLASKKQYKLAWLERNEKTVKGPCGILQPETPILADAAEVDIVIVPGVAFDRRGNRLGHGGGHYDRLLSGRKLCRAFRIGLAFGFQLVKAVPVNKADKRMNVVVTEDGVAILENSRKKKTTSRA